MKPMMRYVLLIVTAMLAALLSAPAFAVTCTSAATGNWNATATWSNCAGGNGAVANTPGSNDTAIIANSHAVTANVAITVGAVTVNSGGTLNVVGNNFTVNGATNVSGTLSHITSASGTKTYIGLVTINSGGTWSNTINETITLRGGLTDNGTFTAGTGVYTFNTNNQDIGGTSAISIPRITVTGVTLTNNGTLTIGTALTGTGEIVNAANTTLNLNGTATITTLTATATGNLVSYGSTGAQTIKATTYYDLNLSGGLVTKTLAGTTTVMDAVVISNGTTLDVSNNNYALNVAGDFTNNGTLNARSGTVTMNGTGTQTIGGSSATTFYNLTINNSGNGIALAGDTTVSNTLTLTNGVVNTGVNTLIMSANCSAGMPSGSSASFVEGLLQLTFPANAITCTFPVGDATTGLYAPITVAFTNSGGGTLTGSTNQDTSNVKQTSANLDTTASANRYWTLTAGTLTFTGSYSATLQFNNPADLDASAVPASFLVRHFTAGTWITPAVGTITSTTAQGTGITQTGFGDFVAGVLAPMSCTPPAGAPSGLVCQCDNFGRSTLNPSTIFGQDWIVSKSDNTTVVPYINTNSGNLRLTEATGSNAKAATVPAAFPASGNYISVEFRQYAYNGGGADGIAVTLSDYAVTAVPGAFGGSLGYAQKSNPGSDCTTTGGCPGFAGGWIGVGLDEYGGYACQNEGRVGGATTCTSNRFPQSVGVRGSGSGMNGYNWLTGALGNQSIDNSASTTPSRGYYYQVIVDARNDPTSTSVSVNRDTTGTGNSYSSLINIPNIYTAATAQGFTQAAVPSNWQISFTGSTGGITNIHEISGLRICAQTSVPPTGGTASGFNAVDEAYGAATTANPVAVQTYLNGHIYMKLVNTPFKLDVAALSNNQIVTTYALSSAQTVTVKLVDNSDGVCILNSTQANYCNSSCKSKTAVNGGTQTITFATNAPDKGQKQSGSFTLNSAYKNLVAIISDGTTTACSTDAFSVRPSGIASVQSIDTPPGTGNAATNTGIAGTPSFKAGNPNFALTATINGITGNPNGYTGFPKINNAGISASNSDPGAITAGSISPTTFPNAAVSSTPTSTATGGTFSYSEVGAFKLLAPNFTVPRIPGVYDDTWTAIDSGSLQNDCNSFTGSPTPSAAAAAYSNTKDANGKYGCYFGISADTGAFGRFYPDHFAISSPSITNRAELGCASTFTYFGEQLNAMFTLTAQAAGNTTTKNYTGTLAKLDPTVFANLQMGAVDRISNPSPPHLLAPVTAGTITCSTTPCFGTSVGTATVTAPFQFARNATTPEGPYTAVSIGINPVDSDGVTVPFDINTTTTAATPFDHGTIASTALRYGRLRIDNAYGTETLNLPVTVEAQYWNGTTNSYNLNTLDNCTPLASGNFSMSNKTGGIASATINFQNGGNLTSGTGRFVLTAPTPVPTSNGSVDESSTFSYLPNIGGRETFGTYKAGPVIYIREIY